MATTAVAIPAAPAHIAAYTQKHESENAAAAAGIKAGSWPRITIGGSKFTIKEGDTAELICDPSNPQLPKMQLELVVAGFNPSVSKTYYEGAWAEGDRDEPDCSSDDGLTPDAHIRAPQSPSCATCRQNQWGSKVTDAGKQIKACADIKRLVVLQADELDGDAYELAIKPGSLKAWALYVQDLNSRKIPVSAVVTLVYFDPAATAPKLLFRFGRYLTPEELAIVEERQQGEDVKLIASPRRTGAQVPVPVTTAPAPAPAPAPVAAPAPAPAAPAVVDPYAGCPPHVKAAVDAAGGLGSVAGDTTYKALTGKEPPAAPAAATAAPPPPPKPVDPYEGLAPHVKAAVEAAGGLASDAGRATYKALAGKDAPAAPASAAAPATGTPRRARRGSQPLMATAPGVEAPKDPLPKGSGAPEPTPTPPPAAQSFSAAPAGQVATPGGAQDIEQLLAAALATPTTPPAA